MTGTRIIDRFVQADPWMERAVCRVEQVDTAVFFPTRRDDVELAQRFCWRCPVRDACLDYALANGEHFGIWGGKSERARARMRRARQKGIDLR